MQFCNGTSWANIGSTALSALTSDVTITSPANGNILQYNGSAWVNVAHQHRHDHHDDGGELAGCDHLHFRVATAGHYGHSCHFRPYQQLAVYYRAIC